MGFVSEVRGPHLSPLEDKGATAPWATIVNGRAGVVCLNEGASRRCSCWNFEILGLRRLRRAVFGRGRIMNRNIWPHLSFDSMSPKKCLNSKKDYKHVLKYTKFES